MLIDKPKRVENFELQSPILFTNQGVLHAPFWRDLNDSVQLPIPLCALKYGNLPPSSSVHTSGVYEWTFGMYQTGRDP